MDVSAVDLVGDFCFEMYLRGTFTSMMLFEDFSCFRVFVYVESRIELIFAKFFWIRSSDCVCAANSFFLLIWYGDYLPCRFWVARFCLQRVAFFRS